MKVTPLAFESLGVRGMATHVSAGILLLTLWGVLFYCMIVAIEYLLVTKRILLRLF